MLDALPVRLGAGGVVDILSAGRDLSRWGLVNGEARLLSASDDLDM